MANNWKAAFYGSREWKRARDLAYRRDQCLCVDCRAEGHITPADEVHHIIPLNSQNYNNPDISLALDNLVSLCNAHHQARHGKATRTTRRYEVDAAGRVIIKDGQHSLPV